MTPTTAEPAPGAGDRPTRPAPGPLDYLRKGVMALASLRLTVVLFAFSIGLVFLGTLAQMEFGIWTVVEQYFWSWYVNVPTDLFRQFGSVFLAERFPKDAPRWTMTFPFPAGKLLGLLMLLNLLAAHLVRFRLTWKRAGVLLIHSGLILLFAGEFVTREYAVEQRMSIRQGASANYTEDTRHIELAFVDSSDPQVDKVAVIPERLLRAGGKVSDPQLPVDVEVLDYFTNSALETVKGGKTNPATAGIGKGLIAVRRPDVSGVDPNQKIDLPAAYVRLTDRDSKADLGTYLVGLRITLEGGHDDVAAGGKSYRMNLRLVRYPKPYSVELHEFRFDRYPGTQKAKNFSSEVTVRNQQGAAEVQHQVIKMNDPLRYAGETFYQSSFDPDENGTVLQVVKNPGWLIPYISCVVVSLGLVLHFGIYLTQFLLRRAAAARAESPVSSESAPAAPTPKPKGWWLPGVCTAIVVLYCLSVFGRMNPEKLPFNLDAFAQLPVLDGGRIKPLDSAARVYLRSISGQAVFVHDKKELPAIKWYLDTLGSDPADKGNEAWDYKVFRIDNEQVLGQLKFAPREGLRYTLNELRPHLRLIEEKGMAAVGKKKTGKKIELEEAKWLELLERLALVRHIAQGYGHDTGDNKFHLLPPQEAGQSWASLGELRAEAEDRAFAMALATARAQVKGRAGGYGPAEEKALLVRLLRDEAERLPEEKRKEIVGVLFDSDPRMMREDMKGMVLDTVLSELSPEQQAAIKGQQTRTVEEIVRANPAAAKWEDLIAARRAKKGDDFNRVLGEYRDQCLGQVTGKDMAKVRLETMYNRFAPFMQCTALYVIVFVLSVLGFVVAAAENRPWGEALRRSASWVLYATLILHTGALIVRMSLMDRPLVFVTNLYSSAVFIGWGCVALGMILERVYPIGIGNTVAAVLGLATTIVAHNLATDDTLEMMQAVLDTNFWLATHVTTVTLGYTATFVAGFLGVVYVLLMLATVVRDGFLEPNPPSFGGLLSFGAAAAGLVGIPLFLLWFLSTALVAKFELVHSSIPTVMLVVAGGAAAFYAGGLLFLKAGETGVDAHGKPTARTLPAAARPLAGMALTPETGKILGQMIYGVVCFATLLSFVGTVLGGIWADQSWGRFWGWDPKENGAVLIVLWNSLILHARWCGLVKDRGVAVLALVGNMICAWSWFGTNQLGIGLHAYGFDTRLADGCTNFWVSQLIVLGLGLIPREYWASATRRPSAAPAPAPAPAPKRKLK